MEEYIKAGFILQEKINATPSTCPSWRSADLVDSDQESFVERTVQFIRIRSQRSSQTGFIIVPMKRFWWEDGLLRSTDPFNYFYKVKSIVSIDWRSRKALCYLGMSIPE